MEASLDKAVKALSKARTIFADDTNALGFLKDLAVKLGLEAN